MNVLRILCCSLMISLFTSAVALASTYTVSSDRYLEPTESHDSFRYSFKEHKVPVRFYFEHDANGIMQLSVRYNKDIIFSRKIGKENYARVFQIYNRDANRYFYLVNASYYMDSNPGDTSLLMGYDPQAKKWQIYANAANYYNPDPDASPWFAVEDGELTLFLSQPGIFHYTYYTFDWNPKANWFSYTQHYKS